MKIFVVLNLVKCPFLVLADPKSPCNLTCNCTTIERSKEEKVLGVAIGDKLTPTPQLGNIFKKANQKLHALSRVKRYVGFE